MTVFVWPNLIPQQQTWERVSVAGLSRSPLDGSTQRVYRPGAWWQVTAAMPAAAGDGSRDHDARRRLDALLSELADQSNSVLYPDLHTNDDGAMDTGTLVTNGYFDQGVTGWTVYNGSEGEITENAYHMKIRRNSGSSEVGGAQTLTTVSGASYFLRGYWDGVHANQGDGRVIVGTTAGASDLLDIDDLNDGAFEGVFTASGASSFLTLIHKNVTSQRFSRFTAIQVSRCGLVSGASQTGRSILADNLPVSTDALIRVGSMVEVGGELHRLTADCDTRVGGATILRLASPVRSAPADNSPVVFHRPAAKMVMSDSHSRADQPGLSAFGLSLVEVFS